MLVKLYLYQIARGEVGEGCYWEAESEQIVRSFNIPSLHDAEEILPVTFTGDTKEGVIAEVKRYLQSQGLHGTIRIVNRSAA